MSEKDEEAVRLLEGAYALSSPADNRSYYRDFARHYDSSFAAALGYVYPGAVARALMACKLPDGPILDVGCGTGLVGVELRKAQPDLLVDGVDISPEMLAVAAQKSLYGRLFEVDLTDDVAALQNGFADGGGYAGLISAGTFTHGHLGPEPIASLISYCRSGAQAVIGVNAAHHQAHGFAPFMDRLVANGRIMAPVYDEVMIYDGSDQDHAGDTALIMRFVIT